MVGTIVSEFGDTDELIQSVHKELLALRAAHGRLTVEKFSQFPALILVFGGGDLLEAFLGFEREMRRYIAEGNRDAAAAAFSITAPADTVLDRLEYVVTEIEAEDGEFRDQRTGRRWSDRGIKTIAAEMVHVAEVRGRLGSELLTIEISGNWQEGLHLTISQLTNKALDERAPLVRFWKHQGDNLVEQSEGLTLDFDEYKAPEVANDMFRLKRYHIIAEIPDEIDDIKVDLGDTLYSISLEGRDAPMRTVTFVDTSDLGPGLDLQFTTYRTLATVEIVRTALAA
ncbi:MAG: hypothetical protein M9953_11045 [Thermomicrobiales bacterium]|nr:hypothetical protein [Thermomicrobiales bacterium]MCO5219175.1 hypothetical protein [Thermomicrobiales bacterium]MCO5225863.1 hypothetical protein [Thermomicrobiales bacterium]MCO5228067.1 hypothetical protein [Thermomicrobiales bacterium]